MSDEELEALRERKLAELQQHLEGPTTPDSPVRVESPDDLDGLVDTHDLVIADFHAEWCGPCQQQTPILAKIAAETDAVVATVDIDRHQELAASYGVRSVPTLVFFAGGEPVERLVGLQSDTALRDRIERQSS